ncbi:MAG: hypothetical protein KDB63_22850 [Nocardioidaceae bacterium]|nr:hypothetical protein [Nocardioidaceae bacterium]
MTEKPTFVDTIREATRQNRRRTLIRAPQPSEEDRPRMSRWPPPRQKEWRLAMLKPWKDRD